MSDTKNRSVAYTLWGFLGFLGSHRFYLSSPIFGLVEIILGLAPFTITFYALAKVPMEGWMPFLTTAGLVWLLMMLVWAYDGYWIYTKFKK